MDQATLARNAGMAAVLRATPDRERLTKAIKAELHGWLTGRKGMFRMEQFRRHWEQAGNEMPASANVWGAITANAVREGWIKPMGYARATGVSSHRAAVQCYQSALRDTPKPKGRKAVTPADQIGLF